MHYALAGGAALAVLLCAAGLGEAGPQRFPASIRTVLASAEPLSHPRGRRLPLLVWPTLRGAVDDDALQEEIVRQLDRRGIAMIATWDPDREDASRKRSLRIARIQQKLGLPVVVNANPCLYRFFDGRTQTAHVDAGGGRFFDESFGKRHKMGCPFAVDFRYPAMRRRVESFVRAYHEAKLPLDLVWGDWEIDGPLEVNRSWEAAKRCTVCRKNIPGIERFEAYQEAVRVKRADMTRRCYVEPILSRYPKCLVGNYGVYPHGGLRYWWDYFERFERYHPHVVDQRAKYRKWFHEFALTGYTFAMPVVYTWQDTFRWYDFEDADYRWFYNLLLVGSNACKHTNRGVPVISFVHWHTVASSGEADPAVRQMSRGAYQELLWHLLLRGTDGLFLWCGRQQDAVETRLVHEVYAASLAHADWLTRGKPVTFDVPKRPGPVVSGLRVGGRVLVRRTDFGKAARRAVRLEVDGRTLTVPPAPGRCQLLELR
jgi:hypothetical protein